MGRLNRKMIFLNYFKIFKNSNITSCDFFYSKQTTFKNISSKYSKLQFLASRKNAKKEKNTRNRMAARRFFCSRISKNISSSEYSEKLINYVSPFKYSAEEAEAEAVKILHK